MPLAPVPASLTTGLLRAEFHTWNLQPMRFLAQPARPCVRPFCVSGLRRRRDGFPEAYAAFFCVQVFFAGLRRKIAPEDIDSPVSSVG